MEQSYENGVQWKLSWMRREGKKKRQVVDGEKIEALIGSKNRQGPYGCFG